MWWIDLFGYADCLVVAVIGIGVIVCCLIGYVVAVVIGRVGFVDCWWCSVVLVVVGVWVVFGVIVVVFCLGWNL